MTREEAIKILEYPVLKWSMEWDEREDGLDQVTGYDIKGITENNPVYLDFEQVAAVVRVYSDEFDQDGKRKEGAGNG